MNTQLNLNDVAWEHLEIILSPEEMDERRIKKSENDEAIEKAKLEVERQKAMIEEEYGVKDKKEHNKTLMHTLLNGYEIVNIKCTKYPNEEDATITFYCAESMLGYEAGEVILARPMTSSERFVYLPQRNRKLTINN